jgi:L-threonylcarbamoyladenylate synthase
MAMLRLEVEASAPALDALTRVAAIIRAGGVAAIPTETLYGLAVDPFNAAAVSRLFAVKGRDLSRAVPLVASDMAQIQRQLGQPPPVLATLAARFWPGPLTVVVPAPPTLPSELTGGSGRVGVRVPGHPVARALCHVYGSVLTATSANISGEPATGDPDGVAASLGDTIDVLLDSGRTPGGPPSTVLDASDGPVRLIRAGAIPWDKVLECLT